MLVEYKGEWEGGGPSGKGKMVYADGGEYDGEWKNNQKTGNGRMYNIANQQNMNARNL